MHRNTPYGTGFLLPFERKQKSEEVSCPYCEEKVYEAWFENTSKWYSYCIIQDALACCQQGLEFSWDDGNHDISEFPDDGVEVEVVGTFITYKDFEEDELSYCQLSNATMTILDDQSGQDESVNQ